jgi:hypothetical protein
LIAKSITQRTPRVVAAMDGDAARLRGAAALVLHRVLFTQTGFEQHNRRGAAHPASKAATKP